MDSHIIIEENFQIVFEVYQILFQKQYKTIKFLNIFAKKLVYEIN
jgi:hypothetical protein